MKKKERKKVKPLGDELRRAVKGFNRHTKREPAERPHWPASLPPPCVSRGDVSVETWMRTGRT